MGHRYVDSRGEWKAVPTEYGPIQPPRRLSKTLYGFRLDDLARFTKEGAFDPEDSPDFRVFYVGRDDVHGVLKYLLARATRSVKLNMFGYDDDELDKMIEGLVENRHVYVQGTLDKSQSKGAHERKILESWALAMRDSFAIGESATHQISHTKGGVIDGLVSFEGSTNWSASGEGIAQGRAQNNTLAVFTHPVQVQRFACELDIEHSVAVHQEEAGRLRAV